MIDYQNRISLAQKAHIDYVSPTNVRSSITGPILSIILRCRHFQKTIVQENLKARAQPRRHSLNRVAFSS